MERRINLLRSTLDPINREKPLLALGKLLSHQLAEKRSVDSLTEVEFSIFSQWGDDGIIQWLIKHLPLTNRTFVEFGVQDYLESNTRFLLMNDNWSGVVMDGSDVNIEKIVDSYYYWRYDLTAKHAFITAENINSLLGEVPFNEDIGILHIDIDGNDYWVWEAISCTQPSIVIMEYNSVFGPERSITIPYHAAFERMEGHHSGIYFGASLGALNHLAGKKGYSLIGCNSAGNNAYFVRDDLLSKTIKPVTLRDGYVASKFRECRREDGTLNFLSGDERLDVLSGMPVVNVESGETETI